MPLLFRILTCRGIALCLEFRMFVLRGSALAWDFWSRELAQRQLAFKWGVHCHLGYPWHSSSGGEGWKGYTYVHGDGYICSERFGVLPGLVSVCGQHFGLRRGAIRRVREELLCRNAFASAFGPFRTRLSWLRLTGLHFCIRGRIGHERRTLLPGFQRSSNACQCRRASATTREEAGRTRVEARGVRGRVTRTPRSDTCHGPKGSASLLSRAAESETGASTRSERFLDSPSWLTGSKLARYNPKKDTYRFDFWITNQRMQNKFKRAAAGKTPRHATRFHHTQANPSLAPRLTINRASKVIAIRTKSRPHENKGSAPGRARVEQGGSTTPIDLFSFHLKQSWQ